MPQPRKLGEAYPTANFIDVPVSNRQCARNSQRIIDISKDKGIKARVCCPKGQFSKGRCQTGMFTRTVLYDKKTWSEREAKKHAKKKFIK